MEQTLKLLVGMGSYLAMTWAGLQWFKVRHVDNMQSPTSEKLLRGPGEFLRAKLELLNERLLVSTIFGAVTVSITLVAVANPMIAIPLTALCGGISVAAMFHPLKEYRKCRLGLRGEQAVAEQLNKLMR